MPLPGAPAPAEGYEVAIVDKATVGDEALAAPWNNFHLTRDAPETILNTKAVRVRLRLSYKGRSWGSVQLEMAPVEGGMG